METGLSWAIKEVASNVRCKNVAKAVTLWRASGSSSVRGRHRGVQLDPACPPSKSTVSSFFFPTAGQADQWQPQPTTRGLPVSPQRRHLHRRSSWPQSNASAAPTQPLAESSWKFLCVHCLSAFRGEFVTSLWSFSCSVRIWLCQLPLQLYNKPLITSHSEYFWTLTGP